jgi:hypothetical protein
VANRELIGGKEWSDMSAKISKLYFGIWVAVGICIGSVLGYNIALWNVDVHIYGPLSPFMYLLTLYSLAPRGLPIGVFLGGLLAILVYISLISRASERSSG